MSAHRLLILAFGLAAAAVAAAPVSAGDPTPTPLALTAYWADPLAGDTPRWSAMPGVADWRAGPWPPLVRERVAPAPAQRVGWPDSVPDPGLYALVGVALLALGLIARRRLR